MMNSTVGMSLFAALILLSFMPAPAMANGGPVDGSNILSTGHVVPVEVNHVALASESIYFTIDRDWVDVEVEYELENKGDAVSVMYAFPVEYASIEWNPYHEWISEEVPYFRIFDGDLELYVEVLVEPDSFLCDVPGFWEMQARRRWYLASLDFDPGENVTLRVEYRFKSLFENYLFSKSFFETYTDRFFRYDLSPASGWGDGTVDDFTCTIDFGLLIRNNGFVIDIPKCGRWLCDSIYRIEKKNLDLAEAGFFDISWNTDVWNLSEYIGRHTIPPDLITGIEVSSVLSSQENSNYGAGNVLDLDFSTAWVEGASGNGAGEWLEISLQGFQVAHISIVNGYMKSRDTYLQNARARQIEYELIPGGYMFEADPILDTLELEDLEWQQVDGSNFTVMMQTLVKLGETGIPLETLHLRVLDVYPGTLYDDLCITELLILGYVHNSESW